jgi:hypothetical protein
MPDLRGTIWRAFGWEFGPSVWSIQKRCGAEGGIGAASLETCSPRMRHMEEIEATRVALDSLLVNAHKLRYRSFGVWPELHSFEKSTHDNDLGINLD